MHKSQWPIYEPLDMVPMTLTYFLHLLKRLEDTFRGTFKENYVNIFLIINKFSLKNNIEKTNQREIIISKCIVQKGWYVQEDKKIK